MRGSKRARDVNHEKLPTTKDAKVTKVFFSFVFFAIFVVVVLFAPSTRAQTFRGSVTTVEIPVTVTDSNNRLIIGLTRDDFEVFEDGDEQPVTQFSDKRTPVSVGEIVTAVERALPLKASDRAPLDPDE